MQFCTQRLKEQGFDNAFLWVLKYNERAIQFYNKIGYINDGATIEVPLDDKILTNLRYCIALR